MSKSKLLFYCFIQIKKCLIRKRQFIAPVMNAMTGTCYLKLLYLEKNLQVLIICCSETAFLFSHNHIFFITESSSTCSRENILCHFRAFSETCCRNLLLFTEPEFCLMCEGRSCHFTHLHQHVFQPLLRQKGMKDGRKVLSLEFSLHVHQCCLLFNTRQEVKCLTCGNL